MNTSIKLTLVAVKAARDVNLIAANNHNLLTCKVNENWRDVLVIVQI